MNIKDEERLRSLGFTSIAINKLKTDLKNGRKLYWTEQSNLDSVLIVAGSTIATCDLYGRYLWLNEFELE